MKHWRTALVVGLAYYAGARFGFALTFEPNPVSILWPPNAILLAALLLAPLRSWPLILAAVLPAHLLAQWVEGLPLSMMLCYYVGNCAEALIGAAGVRWTAGSPFRLDRLRSVLAFLGFAVFLAPFLSSFLDAAFVVLNRWSELPYLELWETRFFSNVVATLTIVPPIVTWSGGALVSLRRAGKTRLAEAALLALALAAFGFVTLVFATATTRSVLPTVLFLPVPILVWAALRFGPTGVSTSFAFVASMVIWGAGHGFGLFQGPTPADSARALQLYLIALAPPLLALAAVLGERERDRRRLHSSEERFARAFRSSPDAMSISRSSDGRLFDVNDRWVALFGHDRVDALGRSLFELLSPSEKDRAELERRPAVGTVVRNLELDARTRRGDPLRIVVAIEAVELEGEACLLTTIRDVTAQRRAELEARQQRHQLTHLSRVHLLGELSGALAHELNQPLTAILSNAQAAQRFLARTPLDIAQVREILEEIAAADQRAATVIHRLRALLRNDTADTVRLDLNEVLEEMLDFAHGEVITHDVRVATRFVPKLPPIEGDRVQLQQLFLNLVTNACEAMNEVEPRERILTIGTAAGSGNVVLATIADSGPGIPGDRLGTVFEPFVTTKEAGLGLGLAICRTIVAAHGGRIWAQNGEERGATFLTEFPAAGEHAG